MYKRQGCITGKPVEFGGSQGRNEATGFGVSIVVRESAKRYGIEMKGARVAVQGFGNVGTFTVKNIARQGAKVVALAEWDKSKGNFALYNEDGINYEESVSYTHLTLPTIAAECRSRWSPYH